MTNLAVNENDPLIQYTSTGETTFAYDFPIRSTDEIKVSVDQVEKTHGTDYTLTGVGDASGGNVVFTSATTSGEIITFWLDKSLQRVSGFSEGAATILPDDLNTEFADIIRDLQMLRRDIRRSIRLAPDDATLFTDVELPAHDPTAAQYIIRDTDGSIALSTAQLDNVVPLTAAALRGYLPELLYSYPTRAAAQAADTGTAQHLMVGDLIYKYDASGTALSTDSSTRNWSPVGIPSPRHWGAVSDIVTPTDAITEIQACADYAEGSMWALDDAYWITDTLKVRDDTHIQGYGRNTGLWSNMTKPSIESITKATTRIYNVSASNFTINNTAKTNAGSVGIEITGITFGKFWNINIGYIETGVYGSGVAAYYNEFHGVDMSTVDDGYIFGTLTNSNKVYGGRINDCTNGTTCNDNTCNIFNGVCVEVFTGVAHIEANTATTQYNKYIHSRIENTGGVGTGFDLASSGSFNAQSVSIISPTMISLSAYYAIGALSIDYHIWDDINFAPYGGQTLKSIVASGTVAYETSVSEEWGVITAHSSADDLQTVTGVLTTDTVEINVVGQPAGFIFTAEAATNGIYFRACNLTSSNTDPAPSGTGITVNYTVMRAAALTVS